MLTEHPLVKFGVDREIIPLLQSNRFWQEVTGHRAAVVDMNHSIAVVVEPATLNVESVAVSMNLQFESRLGAECSLLSKKTAKRQISIYENTYSMTQDSLIRV